MKKSDSLTYTQKIRLRIRFLWLALILMLVYMVVVSELGGGDSRMMTDLATTVSKVLFFGGMVYLIARIVHNKKLLQNRLRMKEQMRNEQDERNQYLHDKSGGTVLDLLLIVELFVTVTAALFNMPAFYTALCLLLVTLFLKITAYLFYSHRG